MYDLLLRNGILLDPGSGLSRRGDLAVREGRIAAQLPPASTAVAREVFDVAGNYLCPGLIDLHGHFYTGVSFLGVSADSACLARGVTTAVDAGSAGAWTYGGFRDFIFARSQTRLRAMLNISAIGMIGDLERQPRLGELEELRHLDVAAAVEVIQAHRDQVIAVKVRLTDSIAANGQNEWAALRKARAVADTTGLPLMVHTPLSSLPLERILAELRSGDLLTHCYHAHRCGIFDEQLRVLPAVREKTVAGLLLDVGHGRGSFSFAHARRGLEQGLPPDIISSDLHTYNLHGPVFDLMTTLNKFLHLGLSLPEVVRRATTNPARICGLKDEIGSLRPGSCADLVVLRELTGEFPLCDSGDVVEIARRQIEPVAVFRAGQPVPVLPRPAAGPPVLR